MPRYHFHCVDGSRIPDYDGMSLPDLATARQEAVRFAGEVLQSEPALLWQKGQWRVEVTGEDGVLLFTLVTLAIDAPQPSAVRSHQTEPPGASNTA